MENTTERNTVKVGDKFILKVGVTVEVVEYKGPTSVIVTDGTYTRQTSVRSLINGVSTWVVNGKVTRATYKRTPIPLKYNKTGAILKGADDDFRIVSVGEDFVEVEFVTSGNTKTIPANKKFKPSDVFDSIPPKGHKEISIEAGHTYYRDKWHVGNRYQSKDYGEFEIVEISNANKIVIRWIDSGHTQKIKAQQLKDDTVRDLSRCGNYLRAKGYYVYCATFEGELLYIGRGKHFRYSHCKSGKSSSYMLNKLHFEGKEVEVGIVLDDLSKADCHALEWYLIYKFKPCANESLVNHISPYAISKAESIINDFGPLKVVPPLFNIES